MPHTELLAALSSNDHMTAAELARQEMGDSMRPADLWHDTESYRRYEGGGDDGSCYMPEEDEASILSAEALAAYRTTLADAEDFARETAQANNAAREALGIFF